MSILRGLFLNTAAFLSTPNDPPSGDVGDVQGDSGDVPNQEDASGGQNDADAGGTGDGADGTGDDGAGDAVVEDDDDADLAELPPEIRAKAKAALEKRIAKEVGWRDRQIDRLYRKSREKEEDNRALETIADTQRRTTTPDPNRKFTQAEVDAAALRLTAQQQYDRDATDADSRGKAVYGDKWGRNLAKLPKLGGVSVEEMVDILATDQPHVVLFQLSDPDVYQRVMDLPPARRRNEFVKLSLVEAPKPRLEVADSKRPSSATPPVTPIQGGRRVAAQQVDIYSDKVDDNEWYKARNEARRKKFSNVE